MKLTGLVAAAVLFFGCVTANCTKTEDELPPLSSPTTVQKVEKIVRKLVSPTTVLLEGGIDDAKAAEFIPVLLEACATHDHVSLEINTGGGMNVAGFRIAKAIEDCGAPVDCVVDGEAQSYGFYLLQSCRLRTMTKRSILMMHESLYPTFQATYINRFALEDYAKNLEVSSRAMAEHYQKRMGIPMEVILENTYRKDWLMGWADAVKFHAVDYAFDNTREAVAVFNLYQTTKK